MGGLACRVRVLEAGRSKDGRALSAEALRFLSDEELEGLLEVLEADIEMGEAWFEDLYAASSERSRRALDAYYETIEAARSPGMCPRGPRRRTGRRTSWS